MCSHVVDVIYNDSPPRISLNTNYTVSPQKGSHQTFANNFLKS